MQGAARNRSGWRGAATFAVHLIALLLQSPLASERRIEVGDVIAYADSAHIALATSMAESAAEPHDWVGLGRVDAGPLILVLARDRADFARWSRGRAPDWGAGVTFPSSHLVIIRLNAGDPFRTLRHELAHVVLHRTVAGRVPLWFDEGYAVVAAQEYGRFAALRLNLAVATGKVPELRALDAALRGSTGDAETAYALAGSAVAEIERRGTNGKLAPFIQLLARGVPFDAAIQAGTGYSIDGFEAAWQRSLRQHYNLAIWLATGGLWLVVTLVLSWAAATRRRREAPRRAALDTGWPEPPADDEMITIQEVGPPST